MKKSLFYFVMGILTIGDLILISFSAFDGQPFKFLAVYIVSLLFVNLAFSSVMGWDTKDFLLLALAVCSGSFLLGVFRAIMNGVPEKFLTNLYYGIRGASTIWPVSALLIVAYHAYTEEAKKKEEVKEERPETEIPEEKK